MFSFADANKRIGQDKTFCRPVILLSCLQTITAGKNIIGAPKIQNSFQNSWKSDNHIGRKIEKKL